MSKKVYIRSFGCQMNDRDSELIADMLSEKGFEMIGDPKEADVILFNTCSVRQHAEDRVTGNLQRLTARKKKDPGFSIGVMGCMAQRHGELLFKEYPQVDFVIGPSNIYDAADVIAKVFLGEKVLAIDNTKRPNRKTPDKVREGLISAYVNIMYGCDNYCSYCIVPHVRGREVSRPRKDVVSEVKSLTERGYKEIRLLGQNVNSYGKGLTNRITFPELLKELNGIKGLERIRFTTSHPKDAGKPLFKAMRDLDKVCESLHLPLQSGSDRILDLMNRKYDYVDYRRKIDQLREMIPGVGISTDMIVGFPSEKERDFGKTRKAMEEIGFDSAFIFKYSPRPPAVSSFLVDDVSPEEKKTRNNELLDFQRKISGNKNRDLADSVQEVLAEGKSRKSENKLIGRTRTNIPCVFEAEEGLIGSIVKVRVSGSSPTTLKGNLLSEEKEECKLEKGENG